jgi:polysaccharide biosynthesis/export protein
MADLRRSALGSESRGLQARARQIEAERTRDDLKMKLQQLDSKQRIALAEGLQSGTLALEVTRTKLQSVSEKLAYSGMIRSQLSRGSFSKPEVQIVRSSGQMSEAVPASDDDELRPGDVVEISLRGLAPLPNGNGEARVTSNNSDNTGRPITERAGK